MALCKDVHEVAIGFGKGVVTIKVHILLQIPFSQMNHSNPAWKRWTQDQHGPIWKTYLYPKPPYSLQTIIFFPNHFQSLLLIHHLLVMFWHLPFALPTHPFHFWADLLSRSHGNIDFSMLPHDFISENRKHPFHLQDSNCILRGHHYHLLLQQEHGGPPQASMSTRPSL